MNFVDRLKALLASSSREQTVTDRETEFVYIVLPEQLVPLDRGSRYENPIDAELRLHELGYVTGGGTQLGEERADGSRPIVFCGIDIEATDLDAVRSLLHDELPELGCVAGTRIEYTKRDRPLQDEYDGSAWRLDRPRSTMHPGFGI